jgi:hypothetical protein
MGEVAEAISRVLRGATRNVVLVAPFMKAGTLARLLEGIGSGVQVECFTRWRPEEVASGVSDLEVADLIEALPQGRLFLVSNLHGKLYCGDNAAIATSANLTATALGWREPANVELSIPLARSASAIADFEARVRTTSVSATPEIRALVEDAATHLPVHPRAGSKWPDHQEEPLGEPSGRLLWMPTTLVPSELFSLYMGRDHHVSRLAADDAYRDLEMLGVPTGLDQAAFRQVVRALLVQHPVLSRLRTMALRKSLSFEDAERLLDFAGNQGFAGAREMFRVAAGWLAWWFSDELVVQQEEGRTRLRSVRRHSD